MNQEQCWWCAQQIPRRRGAGWRTAVIALTPSRTHYCRHHYRALVQLGGDDFGPRLVSADAGGSGVSRAVHRHAPTVVVGRAR